MAEPSTPLDVTVVTGMSGAGRSAAADVLEDLGFFVIDNLPPALIPKVAELGRGREGASHFALVVDTRAGEYLPDLESALAELRESGARTRVLFLDASDEVLVRRFDATRRRHPVAESDRVSDGITRERELLERIKEQADVVVDTSELNVHELRDRLRELFAEFLHSGGQVWLCGACTKPRGIGEDQLEDGVTIVGAARVVEEIVAGARTVAFA